MLAAPLPVGQIAIPVRMDDDFFHRGELLTAFIFKQSVLTSHHAVLTDIRADGDREKKTHYDQMRLFIKHQGRNGRPTDAQCKKLPPYDAVSCCHDVETINNGASADVAEVSFIV